LWRKKKREGGRPSRVVGGGGGGSLALKHSSPIKIIGVYGRGEKKKKKERGNRLSGKKKRVADLSCFLAYARKKGRERSRGGRKGSRRGERPAPCSRPAKRERKNGKKKEFAFPRWRERGKEERKSRGRPPLEVGAGVVQFGLCDQYQKRRRKRVHGVRHYRKKGEKGAASPSARSPASLPGLFRERRKEEGGKVLPMVGGKKKIVSRTGNGCLHCPHHPKRGGKRKRRGGPPYFSWTGGKKKKKKGRGRGRLGISSLGRYAQLVQLRQASSSTPGEEGEGRGKGRLGIRTSTDAVRKGKRKKKGRGGRSTSPYGRTG